LAGFTGANSNRLLKNTIDPGHPGRNLKSPVFSRKKTAGFSGHKNLKGRQVELL